MFASIRNELKIHPLEIKILIIAAVGGFSFSIMTTIGNVFLGLGALLILTTIGTGILDLLVVYLVVVKKSYHFAAYFGIFALMLLLYPILYIFNDGSHGTVAFFMLFNAVFCAVLIKYLNPRIVLVVQLFVVYGLLTWEYLNPDSITPYPDKLTRFIDIGFAFTLVFLLIFYMVARILSEYNKTIVKLEKAHNELKNAHTKLEYVSITDELTGIYNRRFVMCELDHWIEEKKSFSIIMFDIDFFKKVNDTYGHNFGDEVLKGVSHCINSHLRSKDVFGRIGGEEFIILLPDTKIETALTRAREICIKTENLLWDKKTLKVTISGGVDTYKEGLTSDQLLEVVDKKLYEAKENGRNQIK